MGKGLWAPGTHCILTEVTFKQGLITLLFKKTETLTVQMLSYSSAHSIICFLVLFIYLCLTLALSYRCESDLMDWLTILMFDVVKSCWVSLETTKTSLFY